MDHISPHSVHQRQTLTTGDRPMIGLEKTNQIERLVIIHGYIRNGLDERIRDLIGPYQTEEVYVEGGYELTVAMTGAHEPGFLHQLYDCLLLNDYYNESAESFIAYPENGSERVFNKRLRVAVLPEGEDLLANYEDECAEFVLTAVMSGYDQTGKERYAG